MSNSAAKILEPCIDLELDDMLDLTIVMSRKELEAILAIDSAHAEREKVHMRPTIEMDVIKMW